MWSVVLYICQLPQYSEATGKCTLNMAEQPTKRILEPNGLFLLITVIHVIPKGACMHPVIQ